MEYEDEIQLSEEGFSAPLGTARLVQHSLAPNSSLLACDPTTGMLLVGASGAEAEEALLFQDASAVLRACKEDDGPPELRGLPHTTIPLLAPPQQVLWSPDGTLAAVATTTGVIVVYSAQALRRGDVAVVASAQRDPIRQIAFSGDSSRLYVVTQARELFSALLAPGQLALQPERSDVTCVAASGGLVAIGCTKGPAASVTVATLAGGGTLADCFTTPIPFSTDAAMPLLDAMAFIAEDALAIQILSVDEDGGAASDANDVAVLVLDSPLEPTRFQRSLLGPQRFHSLGEPVARPERPRPYLPARDLRRGPYMHVAACAPPYCAAVLALAGAAGDHFVHLWRDAGGEWLEVASDVEGLLAKLPNTPEEEGAESPQGFAANYIIGAAAVLTHRGERLHHPRNESAPAAEVRPLLHECISTHTPHGDCAADSQWAPHAGHAANPFSHVRWTASGCECGLV